MPDSLRCVDGHMFDDFRPYIFKTVDGGKSWDEIAGNLPAKAYVQVVSRDPRTQTCYMPNRAGLVLSFREVKLWMRSTQEPADVPFTNHHSSARKRSDYRNACRSICVFDDVSPIQQMINILNSNAHLFPVRRLCGFATCVHSPYGGSATGNLLGPIP